MSEPSQREAYGRALLAHGALDPRVVVLDADTSASTLSSYFAEKYPDRFYNIGIAEPCMVDVAAGLALGGLVPFVNGFAALLELRALEQVRTCVCYARTNVKLAASYAGLSDFKDGPTHHAITDIAIMRSLPEMTVIVPADAAEIAAWVPVIAQYDGPVYLRLNRAATLPVHSGPVTVAFGQGEILHPGDDAAILTAGAMAGRSLRAALQLEEQGIHARVLNLSSIKPIDRDLVTQAAFETGAIVTAEEHTIVGGLGSAVAETLAESCPTRLIRLGIPDTFALTGPDPDAVMDAFGLGVQDIVSAVQRVVKLKTYPPFPLPGPGRGSRGG